MNIHKINRRKNMYDNDPYKDGFFYKVRQTVFKWWYVVYKPVYKLTHEGRWPQEQEQKFNGRTTSSSTQNKDTEDDAARKQLAEQMVTQIQNHNSQHQVDDLFSDSTSTQSQRSDSGTENVAPDDVSGDVLGRANEIMERLAREAAEDEAKKQAEIDEAKREAAEHQRLASIMKANEVDISPFIEEGKAHQTSVEEDITL
jgi:hypothetical protein